jgi:predicted aspartyl protease
MLKLGEDNFTAGRARFEDNAPWAAEQTAKIYVKITPENLDDVVLFALLDTGAPWSLLDAEVAENLNLLNGNGEPKTIKTWRGDVQGRLERINLRLHADEGDSLDFEATVLVAPDWRGNFLGYGGLLQHIRFGVDATNNFFYFGKN